jgi:5-methylcytosine-specific restriction endonuclease McrA
MEPRHERPTVRLECAHHGVTDFRLRPDGYYRCLKCRAEAVIRRRRRVKETLVSEAGGSCQICGYDRSLAALVFHHLDPKEKSFGIAARGHARAIDSLRAEIKKCVLLCSNCHAEVQAGIATVPPL